MEAILHIEPITRKAEAPLRIGHNDFIMYGEVLTDDGENVGTPASYMTLGCPLETPDFASSNDSSYLPLVKTVECTPDPTQDQAFIYSETLHYLDKHKLLIPYRTKIHSGIGQDLRLTHLPSLNHIRRDLSGDTRKIIDPRQEIVLDLLFKDPFFERQRSMPLHDWLTEELSMFLSNYPVNELTFHKEPITKMVHNYVNQIKNTSSELTPTNLKNIVSAIVPPSLAIPSSYFSPLEITRPISDFRHHCVTTDVNFSSLGNIAIDKLPHIDYNPAEFKDIAEIIDRIPLTDFNIDMVVNAHNEIEFYHEHLALNRFGLFKDQEQQRYIANDLMDRFDCHFVNELLGKFVYCHRSVTPEMVCIITKEPIKIKMIKTFGDEMAIILYQYDSASDEPPLCGVYFDLAIQSLAPLSIIPESVIN